MGCCASSPSSSPYPTHEPTSSSRAITSSQAPSQAALAVPRPSTHASSHSTHTQQPRSSLHQHLSAHINKPLKPHIWTSTTRFWSRAQLDRERIEFFDTRVAGRPEAWQTIKAALEVLWAAAEDDGGLGTAQMIFEAAGITVPTGDLANGVYDSLGAFYTLPEHIVADPTNLVPEVGEEDDGKDDDGAEDPDNSGDTSEEPDEDEILRRREEKGKAVVNPRDLVKVKARLSDRGGRDLEVSIGKHDSVRLFTRRILEDGAFQPGKSIRIAYMGKILNENQTLIAQGWKDGHVVNALVFG